MAHLIHLNGPSRVGKSTLAGRYAGEHAGTLALDVDVLVGLLGGWQENFATCWEIARDHGRALAIRHLRQGYDVVLPQLVTSYDRDPWVEHAAHDAGAVYIEVALTVRADEHITRLNAKRPATAVEAHIQARLEERDCELVGRIRRHLDEYLADRPQTIRIDTTGLEEDASYQALLRALAVADALSHVPNRRRHSG